MEKKETIKRIQTFGFRVAVFRIQGSRSVGEFRLTRGSASDPMCNFTKFGLSPSSW